MGGIADAMMKYAQPLVDNTDGSPEQLQGALSMSQLCWNLALMSEAERNAFLDSMPPMPNMAAEYLEIFKRTIVGPMIQRHHEMFPGMNQLGPMAPSRIVPRDEIPPPAPGRLAKKYAGTGRNSLCPCGSGKKFKKCCGNSSTFVA